MALVALMPTARPRGGDEVACSSEAAEPLQRKSIFRLESVRTARRISSRSATEQRLHSSTAGLKEGREQGPSH